jgi:hypothetical protein
VIGSAARGCFDGRDRLDANEAPRGPLRHLLLGGLLNAAVQRRDSVPGNGVDIVRSRGGSQRNSRITSFFNCSSSLRTSLRHKAKKNDVIPTPENASNHVGLLCNRPPDERDAFYLVVQLTIFISIGGNHGVPHHFLR